MRQISARLLSLIPGLIFLIQAYAWVTNPSKASNDLGMIYLEGIGRSTQIGDFSAFFISVSIFCLLGSIFKNITFLISAVIILVSSLGLSFCTLPSLDKAVFLILVAVNPGHAIRTCNPFLRFSIRSDSKNPCIANLEAE